jgi:hypothetical protein
MRRTLLALLILCTGCAQTYVTPGRAAPMQLFGATPQEQKNNADFGIQSILDKKPLAAFPASIAVVRVQATDYQSRTNCGYGSGQYSVVTTRDVEADADMSRLSAFPMLRGVATLNRLVIPGTLNSDFELRQAAAKMHADLLVIYTIDTQFIEKSRANALTLLTLGTTTTDNTRILSTASAAILDTRSGYVYGLAEGTHRLEQHRNAWKTEDEVDQDRRHTESLAFHDLIQNLGSTWNAVVAQYAIPNRVTGVDGSRYQTPQGN